jgi:hypothetical protein
MDLANLYDFAGTDPDDISTFTNSEIFSHDSSPYAN